MGRWKSEAYQYARSTQGGSTPYWGRHILKGKCDAPLYGVYLPRILEKANRAHYVTIPEGNIAALAARWVPQAEEEAAEWAEVRRAQSTAL